MSDSLSNICEEYITFGEKMKLDGRRWEYPIPKSKEYWEKFCENEEKKLLVVRDPSVKLSYSSFSKNDSKPVHFNEFSNNKASNVNSYKFHVDDSVVSKGSLHKLSIATSRRKLNKNYNNAADLFPKSISKVPSQAPSKRPDTSCNLGTPSKVVRIPKLDTLSSQPSFRKIFSGKLDHIRSSFDVQNELKAQGKSLSTSSSTLPLLNGHPAVSVQESKLTKSDHSKLAHRDSLPKIKSTPSTKHHPQETFLQIPDTNVNIQTLESHQSSLKYSIRRAYKALKHLTPNKKLNFDPRTVEYLSDQSVSRLKNHSPHSDNERMKLLEFRDTEKSTEILKDSQFTGIDAQYTTLKSEETTSTIPSGSRSTSGPSPRFMHPEPWKSPSSCVLSSIPKLSSFPRKYRDKCLPCMHKTFEVQPERKISLPLTALQRIINSQKTQVAPPQETTEDSDTISISIPDFEDKTERILNCEVNTEGVMFDEAYNIQESQIVKETPALSQEKYEEVRTEVGRSDPNSESSHKAITQKDKEYQRDDESTSVGKNLNDTAKSEQVPPLERFRVSSSFHSCSSEEDDSLAMSIGEDQSKPKYLAPCHAPTVFKPSLEPLKALRNRKPTTLQDRIAFLESSPMKYSTSIEDFDEAQEKQKSKDVLQKTEAGKGKKDGPTGRILTKAKSVPEEFTLEKVEQATRKEHVLRKGTSFANFSVTKDDYDAEKGEYPSKEVLKELGTDSPSKTTAQFSKLVSKLPLRDVNEIVELLKDIKEVASSASMLEILCKEFSERLSRNVSNDDSEMEKNRKMIATLTRLLVDSKRYLNPDKFPSDLLFSTNQPPPCNPRLLQRILPQNSYNLVAPLLGLPEWYKKRRISYVDDNDRTSSSETTMTNDDHSSASLEVHPPMPGDIESLSDEEKVGHHRTYNPYTLFLKKPRRKVITWRPLKKADLEGYDADATLKMRADNIMSRICKDFCQWLETLGGTDNTVDEEILQDMFEIDFKAEACKAMQVLFKEMPVVPAEVAFIRHTPGASKLAMTKKHVMRDAKAERTPAKTKAFGTAIPWGLKFVPPKNHVSKNWLQCEHVPMDLESMDMVWKDITHLKSVRAFVEWLQQHPEVPPPEALKTLLSMDIEALRQVEDDEGFAHLELDIYQITSLRVIDTGEQ